MIKAINSYNSTNTYIDTIKRTVDSKNIVFEKLLTNDKKEDNYKNHVDNYVKTYSNANSYETSKTYTRNSKETNTDSKSNDAETKSDIIIKSDGSRVLIITMKVGGMESTTSLEISKPTNIINSKNDSVEKNNELKLHADAYAISNEVDEVLINENNL